MFIEHSTQVKHNVRVVSIALGAKASTSLEVAIKIMTIMVTGQVIILIVMVICSFDNVAELGYSCNDFRT